MKHTLALMNSFNHFNICPIGNQIETPKSPCHVFINHRGIDTKRNVAGLLFDYLDKLNLYPFLDCRCLKPGGRLFDDIDNAILGCKVGIAIFSPKYCESTHCLHELALLIQAKKRVIPIFYDIKPSKLKVIDNGSYPVEDLLRYSYALEEARNIVGITFDPSQGDWSELLKKASDAVIKNLIEVDEEWASKNLDYIVNNN